MSENLNPQPGQPFIQRQLGFVEAVKRGLLEKYCDFTGRASLSEFWWFVLFSAIISWVFSLFLGHGWFSWVLYSIVSLALLLPSLGVTVRRLHDTGKGGGWVFVSFIPLVGVIWLLVLCAQQSEPKENRFGKIPNVDAVI
ncbi:MAG: DUF805 domain-containing protein [Muribaculaceae bacterium]|nr:DUF805 domain-containing protein [Muribaculaceae bacterium]